MKRTLIHFKNEFKVRLSNRRCQAAEMVLAPGEKEGGPKNRHRDSDQWLFVVEGQGLAKISGHRLKLRKGMLVLIESGNRHEIRNTETIPLKTLNFYVPPAYTKTGRRLSAGRP